MTAARMCQMQNDELIDSKTKAVIATPILT